MAPDQTQWLIQKTPTQKSIVLARLVRSLSRLSGLNNVVALYRIQHKKPELKIIFRHKNGAEGRT